MQCQFNKKLRYFNNSIGRAIGDKFLLYIRVLEGYKYLTLEISFCLKRL